MNERRTALVRLAAGQLALIVGMLHVWLGIRQWSVYAVGGIFLPPDVRVPLWTISGLALLVGVAIVALEEIDSASMYLAGIILSLAYILGFYSWHLGGHRSFFVVGDPQLHDSGILEFLLDHTFASPVETVALVTEAGLLLTLVLLSRASNSAEPS